MFPLLALTDELRSRACQLNIAFFVRHAKLAIYQIFVACGGVFAQRWSGSVDFGSSVGGWPQACHQPRVMTFRATRIALVR